MQTRILICLLVLLCTTHVKADYIADRAATMTLVKENKHHEALTAFVALSKIDITDVQKTDALQQAVKCAIQLKDFDKALDIADSIPVPAYAKASKISVLVTQRAWQQLIDQFKDEPLETWPSAAAGPSLSGRGLAYYYLKDGAAAEADLTRALDFIPSQFYRSEVLNNLAGVYQTLLRDENRALESYRQVIDLQGNSNSWIAFTAMLQVASILQAQGKLDEAYKALERANLPDNVWGGRVLAQRGEVLAAQGKKDQAIAAFTAAAAVSNLPSNYAAQWQKRITTLQGSDQ